MAPILALALILSTAACLVSPAWLWLMGVVAIAFPALWLLTFGATLRWAASKRWTHCWWTVPALGLAAWFHGPAYLNWHTQERGTIKVLSGNVNYFGGTRATRSIPQAFKIWHNLEPDLMCLQESSSDTVAHNEQVETQAAELLQLPFARYGSLQARGIYSRGYISDGLFKDFPDSYNGLTYVDTELAGRKVRCYNLHLQSYGLARSNGLSLNFEFFRQGLRKRASQAEWVAESIRQSPYPVLVCGDFNDVPSSYPYRQLCDTLQDGFRLKGRGFAYSHAPLVRIDYILASSHLEFRSFRYVDGPEFSDHRWVFAELSWRDQK